MQRKKPSYIAKPSSHSINLSRSKTQMKKLTITKTTTLVILSVLGITAAGCSLSHTQASANEIYVDKRCLFNPNLDPIDKFAVTYTSEFIAQGERYWLSAATYQDGAAIFCISRPDFVEAKPLDTSELIYQFVESIVIDTNSDAVFIVTIREGQNYPVPLTDYRLDLSNPERPIVTRLGTR